MTTIRRIDPAYWYVGMRNSHLQLMVWGEGIAGVRQVTTDYPGVTIEKVVCLESPNYLFIYIDIGKAKAGVMSLHIGTVAVDYELRRRERKGEQRKSFSMADVIYLLMPDRFAQGSNHPDYVEGMRPYQEDRSQPSLRHGGDLNGIREHLDYFCQLGVTALWLTPVLENNSADTDSGFSSYHGYAVTDYYRVDPRLGTLDDYRRLCDEAHGKGLKIVMDMVFNHCGIDHPWLSDPPSADWVNGTPDHHVATSYKLTPVLDPYASRIDRQETVEGWFTPTMPDLNQRNPHLMRYLIQNTKWWIETVGVDGIRMDTYPYADAEAMNQWLQEIREEYPHFNVVGETWVTEPAYTATWQRELPTVMDFAFYDRVGKAVDEETDDWWHGMNRVYNTLVYDFLYPHPESVMAFLDNHDTDRFLHGRRDMLKLKQALALLLTVRRIPQIYYGTEILMNGTADHTDGDIRRDFPGGFPDDSRSAFTAEGRTRTEQELFRWLSRLLHWRQGSEVIARGRQLHFIPYRGIYVVARQYQNQTVLTILNGTSKTVVMPIARYAEVIGDTSHAKDVLTHRCYDLSQDLRLKPRQSLVLEF